MTTLYTSQSTGVIDQANSTIMEQVPYMLDDAGLLKMYWAFVVPGVVYLMNHTLA
jgi:hypothetical protein